MKGKPHLGFYKHVIKEAKIDPHRAIFIDNEAENVLSARSLGFDGIVLSRHKSAEVKRALRNLLSDPVMRARNYLQRNARRLQSISETGVILQENFAQLLILELTGDKCSCILPEESWLTLITEIWSTSLSILAPGTSSTVLKEIRSAVLILTFLGEEKECLPQHPIHAISTLLLLP
jgi:hypothetical protein